jgi:diaminopropionate ammonia-lyase
MSSGYRHYENTQRLSVASETAAAIGVANLQNWGPAVEEVHGWPGYEPQPLWALPNRARRLGIADLYYKDESQRFGRELASFKALGAPYAVFSLLCDAVEQATGRRPTAAELRAGELKAITERVTMCVATDGNQGRGLAFGAETFGCRCVVYIHGHVSEGRKEAIERYGAIVIRIDGEYEQSVARAREDSRINGWHFVSSTSWDDFNEPIPRYVMHAYMVMVEEALAQLPGDRAVTHVFMQGGVGSIPAAIFLGFAKQGSGPIPRFVVVEPVEADCLYQTAVNGKPTPSAGTLKTIMAGLACREVSPAAWKLLEWLASDYVAIPDSWSSHAMTTLADGAGDVPIVSGESAAAGLGVLLKTAEDPELRGKLGLNEASQVVLFGGEGATDPQIYAEIVGCSADEVFERQREI